MFSVKSPVLFIIRNCF